MTTYFIEKRIEEYKVFEIEAKDCEEAKKLIDKDEKNGKQVDCRVEKALLNVSGLYKNKV